MLKNIVDSTQLLLLFIIITINLYSTFPKKLNVLYNKLITTKQIQHTYQNIIEDTLVQQIY